MCLSVHLTVTIFVCLCLSACNFVFVSLCIYAFACIYVCLCKKKKCLPLPALWVVPCLCLYVFMCLQLSVPPCLCVCSCPYVSLLCAFYSQHPMENVNLHASPASMHLLLPSLISLVGLLHHLSIPYSPLSTQHLPFFPTLGPQPFVKVCVACNL